MSKELPIYLKFKGRPDSVTPPHAQLKESNKILMWGGMGGAIATGTLYVFENAGKARGIPTDLTPIGFSLASLGITLFGIGKDMLQIRRLNQTKNEAHDLNRTPSFPKPSDATSQK